MQANTKQWRVGGGLLGVFALGALSGCIIYVEDPPTARRYGPPAPTVIVEDETVGPDDYIYYPDYEVYYALNRREYYCLEGNAWVWRASPWGISSDWLLRSPGVRMDFHDRPEHHHPRVAQQYPRRWRHDGGAGDSRAGQPGDHRAPRTDYPRADQPDHRRDGPSSDGRIAQPDERRRPRPDDRPADRPTGHGNGDAPRVGRTEPRPQPPVSQAGRPEPKSGDEKPEKVRDPREGPREIYR